MIEVPGSELLPAVRSGGAVPPLLSHVAGMYDRSTLVPVPEKPVQATVLAVVGPVSSPGKQEPAKQLGGALAQLEPAAGQSESTVHDEKQPLQSPSGKAGWPAPNPENVAMATFWTFEFWLAEKRPGIEMGAKRLFTVALPVARTAFSGAPPAWKLLPFQYPIWTSDAAMVAAWPSI